MNRFLANAIARVNAFVAIIIITVSVVVGIASNNISVLLLSILCGVIGAIFTCGLIALFVDMRDELVQIRAILQKRTDP